MIAIVFPEIKEQLDSVYKFLETRYNIKSSKLPDNFNEFLERTIYTIIAIKLWVSNIEKDTTRDPIQNQGEILYFFKEVVSDLNNFLILGSLGFKSASYLFIRRGLENFMKFIYFKDHPVEYYSTPYIEPKILREYLKKYPPKLIIIRSRFTDNDTERIKNILKELNQELDYLYRKTSRYVHGQSKINLELVEYLNDLGPGDEEYFKNLTSLIERFSLIIQGTLILIYNEIYRKLDANQKKIIHMSIPTHKGIKQDILSLY